MRRISKYIIIALLYAGFLEAAILFKGPGYSDWIFVMVTVVVFTFAIFLAFAIANRRDRVLSIREYLRESDSVTIAIYRVSAIFGSDVQKRVQNFLDEYLICQLDYKLEDFSKSEGKLNDLYKYVVSLKIENDEQKDVKNMMLEYLKDSMTLRQKIEFTISDKLQPYEWLSNYALLFVFLFVLYYVNIQTAASLFLIPILATVISIVFLLIYDLDSLRWQEQTWIWNPLSELFKTLDLLPYIPDGVVEGGRLPKKFFKGLGDYRLATNKYPYPDMRDKTIKIIKQ